MSQECCTILSLKIRRIHRVFMSEVYNNDKEFIAHLANPAVGEYLQEHPKIADDFTVEVYGTVGHKCLKVMKKLAFHLRFLIPSLDTAGYK